ncbi:hypothetical protein [Saccharopolyspora taberi]|uniref:Uncharacterized protein n=1 Tax=Saccharopolyspora taberi TaxID=60895 RepID=A0ABN3V4J9_9PSEU
MSKVKKVCDLKRGDVLLWSGKPMPVSSVDVTPKRVIVQVGDVEFLYDHDATETVR